MVVSKGLKVHPGSVLGMPHGDLESSLVLLDCPLLVSGCMAPERSLPLHMNERISTEGN